MKSFHDLAHAVEVGFAGNALQIRTDSQLAVEVAQFVFRHHLQALDDKACPTIEVVGEVDGDGFQLMAQGQLAAIALSESELAVLLMQLAQRQLVFGESRCAMLHAALLVREDCGFLLPATAGSGKTTLTAWLLGHGFSLLSDELVAIEESGFADGFTRPMNVKSGSLSLVNSFEWMDAPLRRSCLSNGVTLVPWDRCPTGASRVRIILYPSYEARALFSAEGLSRGRCVKELMGSLLNARNLPKNGLTFANQLAGNFPAYRITYSRVDDVSNWLDQAPQAQQTRP